MKRNDIGAAIYHRVDRQMAGLVKLCIQVCHEMNGATTRVADIGSCMGESASIFAVYFNRVYAVDTWARDDWEVVRRVTGWDVPYEEVERSFDARMKDAAGLICKVKSGSFAAAGRFPDRFFDLVYIDASHDYKSVVEDISAWLPKTWKFIGGHDYCDTGDVRPAVEDILGGPDWLFEDSSWLKMV